MGQFSGELVKAGYEVTVMTLAFPARTADVYQGVRIAGVAMAEFSGAIRAAVASGAYGTCILIQDPLGNIIWSVEGLTRPPHTRLLIQPIINEDGYGRWSGNADFSARLGAIFKAADVPLVMTKSGPDTRFMRAAGVDAVYLPNATTQVAPAGDFRTQFGIAPERFLVLHVANLFWVKNHIGLIDALPDMPPSWQLVMVGNMTGADCVEAVTAKLATRPDIKFIPGLPREWVAAAMQAADVVVLASHGEGSPITILEAMSHRKPWLATPQCGAANDHVGGVICELADFKAHLQVLADHPAIRQSLGELSYIHWKECYSWPVAIRGWLDLIEEGRLRRPFELEPALLDEMRAVRQRIDAALRADGAPWREARIGLLVGRRGGRHDRLANNLAAALADAFRFELFYASDNPDFPAAALDLLVDFSSREGAPRWSFPPNQLVKYIDSPAADPNQLAGAEMFLAASAGVQAHYAPLCDIEYCQDEVDFDIFNVDAYRAGPIRFGWLGELGQNQREVFEILLPALGEQFQVAIQSPAGAPRELAAFYNAIDVLLLPSYGAVAALQEGMACGVFPVGLSGSAVANLLVHQQSGWVAEGSAAALRAALQWCAANGDELRKIGYRNAQAVAAGRYRPHFQRVWKRFFTRALEHARPAGPTAAPAA